MSRASVRKTAKTLEAELARLRALVREVGEACLTNLEAEVVQIANDLDAAREELTDDRALARMVEEVRALRVKPGKGRVKDLKRIDLLIDRLEEILRDVQ